MIIIAGSSHQKLAAEIAGLLGIKSVDADVRRFADQELRIQIKSNLHGEDVVIVQSTTNPANEHLMELLLLVDTARRAGANMITAVIPYFGYSRQDRSSYEYGPISASLIATLLEAAGVDRIITLDLHSKQTEGFFKVWVQNLDPSTLFTPLFTEPDDYIVVSPDVGGLMRAHSFSNHFGVGLAVINKTRKPYEECSVVEVIGLVRDKHCIVVDDIVDSFRTLCLATELLMSKGAKCVTACVTHAVLSGHSKELVAQSAIKRLYVTDSIPHHTLPKKIQELKVAQMLANTISK